MKKTINIIINKFKIYSKELIQLLIVHSMLNLIVQ